MEGKRKLSTSSEGTASPTTKARKIDEAAAVGPSVKKTQMCGVKLKDGILSLEETPEYLVDIVKRNASASPLLRLPAELRDRIWKLALSFPCIDFPIVFSNLENDYAYAGVPAQRFETHYVKVPSALRLPQVCRQIYSETGTLAYSLNTFSFRNSHVMENFATDMRKFPALLRSIQRIELVDECILCGVYLDEYDSIWLDLDTNEFDITAITSRVEARKMLTERFPGLRQVFLSLVAVDEWQFHEHCFGESNSLASSEKRIIEVIKAVEMSGGRDLDVIFVD